MKMSKILLSTLLVGTILATPVVDAWAAKGNGGGGSVRTAAERNKNKKSSTTDQSKSASGSTSENKSSESTQNNSSGSEGSGGSGGGDTWQQGGAATNQANSSAADLQQNVATVAAWFGAINSMISFYNSWIPWKSVSVGSFLVAIPVPPFVVPVGFALPNDGYLPHGLNFDLLGAAVDGWAVYDAYNKKAKLSEEPEPMQAAVRNIGEAEELSDECEGDVSGTCNALNAKLDGTEVHVATLENVGLEAIEDVAGMVLLSPEELLAAAPFVREGFGTNTVEETIKVNGEEVTVERTLTDEELQKMDLRKSGHLQLTGTAGVARADLGTTVAEAERDQYERLSSYVGSGKGLVANIKVLCGLDLTLAQRLNLLNMLYGQQAANEAATALQHLQNK